MKKPIFDIFHYETEFKDFKGDRCKYLCKYLFYEASNTEKPTYMRQKQMYRNLAWEITSRAYATTMDAKRWHGKLTDI